MVGCTIETDWLGSCFFSALGDLQFTNRIHGISGAVALPDSRTISVTDFNYDGGGVGRIKRLAN